MFYMVISVSDRVEYIEGKKKMLVTSILSFTHNVFKSFLNTELLPMNRLSLYKEKNKTFLNIRSKFL